MILLLEVAPHRDNYNGHEKSKYSTGVAFFFFISAALFIIMLLEVFIFFRGYWFDICVQISIEYFTKCAIALCVSGGTKRADHWLISVSCVHSTLIGKKCCP